MRTRKATTLALLSAIALTIFFLEAQIPALVPVPGVKLGLANIVTMFAVFVLGAKDGAVILLVRVFLGAVFSGNFGSIFYSAAGGALAILTTIGLKFVLQESQIWIAGCLSAVAHSVGQMIVAFLIAGTPSLLIYLPIMIVCSVITGAFTGLCVQLLVKRGKKRWKTFFK